MPLGASRALAGEVPLVGRERDRALLERWLEPSLAGDPHIVVVTGLAGVGKTRLIDWLSERAAALGAVVHSGSCLAGAPASHLPFRTALADLRTGDGTPVVDLFDPPQPEGPDDRQVAAGSSSNSLMAVADALVDAARQAPRLIVIDDLQWADPPTLGLVSQLATLLGHRASSAEVPVMLVVGCRTGDAGEPQQRLVRSLQREPHARLLEVGGLDPLEVVALVRELAGARPTRELGRQVSEATGGNPLLTIWLLRRLLAEGSVAEEGGVLRVTARGPLHLDAADLDEELSRRVAALSGPAREVLALAAGLGDGGLVGDLSLVDGRAEAELDGLVGELEDAGLLRDDGHRYHLAHGQLRQVVLGSLTTRARRDLHRRIAERLDAAYGTAPGDHLLALAEHLLRGRAAPDRLAEVCAAAADRAVAAQDWGRAAQFYEAALDAADAADAVVGAGPHRAEWSLGAGIAHFQVLDLQRAEARLRDAIRLAGDDLHLHGRAALALTRCRLTQGSRQVGRLIDLSELEGFLVVAEAADAEPGLRALALGLQSEAHFSAFDLAAGFEASRRARQLSVGVGDDAVSCMVEVAEGIQHLGALRLDEAAACFDRSIEHGRRRDPGLPLGAIGRRALVAWMRGDLDHAEALVAESIAETEPKHQWPEQSFAVACSVGLALLRGDHRAVEQLGEQARRLHRASDYAFAALQLYPALAWSRALRGDHAGAQEAIDEWRGPGRGGGTLRPVMSALAGQRDLTAADIPVWWRDPPPSTLGLLDVSLLVGRVELGDALADEAIVVPALEPLEQLIELGIAFAVDRGSFLPRLAGVAALRAGLLDRAEHHLVAADSSLRASGRCPGELARCRLDLARLHIARDHRGDRDEAARLLEAATAGFDQLGMLPFIERAASVREVLPTVRVARAVPSVALRVILVTDLVGSTQLNVRLGDEGYVDVLADHDRLIRARLRQHDGVEFKHTGDGFCAWFASGDDAVRAAAGLQRDLDEWRELHPEVDVRVRCGLAAGRPVEVGGDLFGASVAMASRVCALAEGDEVLVNEDVRDLLTPAAAERCEPRGSSALKGFPGEVPIYMVQVGP